MREKGISLCKKVYHAVTNPGLFALVYLTLTVLRSFPLLDSILDWPVRICTIWSILLIGYLLLTRKRLKAMPGVLIAIIMLGCFCLSLVVNAKYVFYSGAKLILYNGIYVLLLYTQASTESLDGIKKTLKRMNEILIEIGMVAAILSILMFCLNIGFRVTIGGTVFRQGLYGSRLFGVYISPNVGALMCLITVMASMMNNLLDRGSVFKFNRRYIVNAVLALFYFSMAISFGGYLTYFAILLMFCLVILLPRFQEKSGGLPGVLKTAGVLVASVVVLVGACFAINKCMIYIPRATKDISFVKTMNQKIDAWAMGEAPGTPGGEATEPGSEPEPDLDRYIPNGDISDGRFKIWETVLDFWKEVPLLGVSDGEIYSNGEYRCRIPESNVTDANRHWLVKFAAHNHNVYIQTLFYSGILGFAAFMTLCIYNVVIYIRYLKNAPEKKELYHLVGLLFCIAAGFAANALVETHLMFNYYDPYGVIFWMYLGMGAVLAKRYYKGKTVKAQ